jgi:hypothetical protein
MREINARLLLLKPSINFMNKSELKELIRQCLNEEIVTNLNIEKIAREEGRLGQITKICYDIIMPDSGKENPVFSEDGEVSKRTGKKAYRFEFPPGNVRLFQMEDGRIFLNFQKLSEDLTNKNDADAKNIISKFLEKNVGIV